MKFDIVTLLPEMFRALDAGITGRAIERDLLNIQCWNPRDFTQDKHRTVDDRPYGGGPGMVMMVEPIRSAIADIRAQDDPTAATAKVIHLTPQGRRLDQATLQRFSTQDHLILLAGRYEGIDERLIDTLVDEECSIGDYVLSGGELAAMVLIDGVTRLLPGALGHEDSAKCDSFVAELLDFPHYTRPESLAGHRVPEVLLSGDHQAIARWRLKQALGRTWNRRPDLLKGRALTGDEQTLLDEFIEEERQQK